MSHLLLTPSWNPAGALGDQCLQAAIPQPLHRAVPVFCIDDLCLPPHLLSWRGASGKDTFRQGHLLPNHNLTEIFLSWGTCFSQNLWTWVVLLKLLVREYVQLRFLIALVKLIWHFLVNIKKCQGVGIQLERGTW